jgi:sugar/nucleoside kinase (ribokinase family)
VLGHPALLVVKCAEADRRQLLRPLVRLGVPVLWRTGESTASFTFHYDGERRQMVVDSLGPSWTPADLHGLDRARWVHVGGLARSDFPPETLAALARDRRRRISFDGQGLVRPEQTGPLRLDAGFDPQVLRHVAVLKLAEEEAHVLLGGLDLVSLRSLDVPEVVVTLGSRGSLVLAEGRLERVAPVAVERKVDPTGAGDAFAAAYLVFRARGHGPAPAARRAAAVVAGLLGGRLR